jgi:hypothetical protein
LPRIKKGVSKMKNQEIIEKIRSYARTHDIAETDSPDFILNEYEFEKFLDTLISQC